MHYTACFRFNAMTIRKTSLCSILLFTLVACSTDDDGDQFASLGTSPATLSNSSSMNGDGDGDPAETSGDGDGDSTGDGDGDPSTGDGDGDPTTGDGDGDPTTGDGDGDPTTGDGDGDPPMSCGWVANEGYYGCGGNGTDPNGAPITCPPGLVEAAPCGDLDGTGCCDDNGDNWYCGDDGMTTYVVKEVCP